MILAGLALAGLAAAADDPTVSFTKDLLPLLRRSCQGCHQPAKAEAELDLTSYEGLRTGGYSGEPLLTEDPARSLLLAVISPADGEPSAMPKDGAPLSAAEVEQFRRWLAAGAVDDTPPSVRDPVTPEHPPQYRRPPVLTAVAFSPDGALLAVSGDHEVLLWSADGSDLVRRLVGRSERIQSLAWAPDGARLAVAGGSPARLGEVQVWDATDGTLLLSRTLTFDTLYGVRWSPDGALVSVGCGDNTVRALRADTGAEVLYQGAHGDWVLDTVFSRDGAWLISVSRDRSMKLIQVATQQFIDNITSITPGALKGGILSVDGHPTRDEVVVGGADGVPRRYRIFRENKRVIGDDDNRLMAYEALPGRVFAVRFSADGATLVAASSDQGTGMVRAYATDDGAVRWTYSAPAPVYSVSVHPDGRVAAAGFDGTVRLLDGADGSLLHAFVPVPLPAAAAATGGPR